MSTDLVGVPLLHRGKARDVYAAGEDLLIVSTDRLSAFDCVLPTPIPDKGRVLTQLSVFWFGWTQRLCKNHLLTADVASYPSALKSHAAMLRGRSMLVRRARRVDVECVARGYLSGNGWKEYRATGQVQGHKLPAGLVEADKLPEPIFTPTTKAEAGHDEPITLGQLRDLVGSALARELEEKTLGIYAAAAQYAAERGIILADTKLEFGHVGDELIVIDEMLTPDSSRFWEAPAYRPGGPQPSYDKQYVRDWLEQTGWNKEPPAPALPADVVENTARRYRQAYEKLVGKALP